MDLTSTPLSVSAAVPDIPHLDSVVIMDGDAPQPQPVSVVVPDGTLPDSLVVRKLVGDSAQPKAL